jgi:predicted Zn-dependent protease
MDRFDRIAIGAVTALAVGSVVLMLGHRADRPTDRSPQQRVQSAGAAAPKEEIAPQLTLIRNLIEAGSLAQAEALIGELQKKFPYEGELSMLLGDVLMRKQEPVKAMHAYKTAIELNPDYLDKKTPLFQGKKLKVAVGEAQTAIDEQLRQHPGDEALKREKKTIYYLYRKIAGSCG